MEVENIFATGITLEDARESIRGCPEFFEKRENDTIVFSYKYCTQRTFPSLENFAGRELHLQKVKRECRGLIFNAETGEIISRRYHKFFNIGELPETKPEKIDFTKPYIVLTKYDGQLVSPVRSMGRTVFASKSGVGDITKLIESRFFATSENDKYIKFADEWLDQGYTPIFEWCSPGSKVVLDYGKDIMVLTGIRHMISGEYIKYAVMAESAQRYDIQITEVHVGDIKDIDLFQKDLQAKELIEGVVIRFEGDGSMYKVKTTWYFKKSHKDKQEFSLNSERSIWKLILNQEIDDALVFASDQKLSDRVKPFEGELFAAIERVAQDLERVASQFRNLDRKSFSEKANGLQPEDLQIEYVLTLSDEDKAAFMETFRILFLKMYIPLNTFEMLMEFVKKNCSSQAKLSKCQVLLGLKLY